MEKITRGMVFTNIVKYFSIEALFVCVGAILGSIFLSKISPIVAIFLVIGGIIISLFIRFISYTNVSYKEIFWDILIPPLTANNDDYILDGDRVRYPMFINYIISVIVGFSGFPLFKGVYLFSGREFELGNFIGLYVLVYIVILVMMFSEYLDDGKILSYPRLMWVAVLFIVPVIVVKCLGLCKFITSSDIVAVVLSDASGIQNYELIAIIFIMGVLYFTAFFVIFIIEDALEDKDSINSYVHVEDYSKTVSRFLTLYIFMFLVLAM